MKTLWIKVELLKALPEVLWLSFLHWLEERSKSDGLWFLGIIYGIWCVVVGVFIGVMWGISALLGG